MGEIIFSICIGGLLATAGVVLIVVLKREEKQLGLDEGDRKNN